MEVPDAKDGSYEHAIDHAEVGDSIFIFDRDDEASYEHLLEPRGHRAIGVVYDPRTEHWGNYVPTILPRRYDAFLYIEDTRAVDPLHMAVLVDGEPPETYPSGE